MGSIETSSLLCKVCLISLIYAILQCKCHGSARDEMAECIRIHCEKFISFFPARRVHTVAALAVKVAFKSGVHTRAAILLIHRVHYSISFKSLHQ